MEWPGTLRIVVLLLTSLAFSACIQDDEESPPETSGSGSGPDAAFGFEPERPYTFGYNATHCDEVDVIMLVDLAQANDQLPAGFRARDAQGLVGTPVATGKGAVFFNVLRCAETNLNSSMVEEAQFGVFVEEPTVPGERPAATLSFYELGRATNGRQLEIVEAMGWASFEGVFAVAITPTAGGGATATGSLEDATGPVYTIELTTPAMDRFDGIGRFWHRLPNGVGWVDYAFVNDITQGGATCTLRAGSPVAVATGRTACAPQETLSFLIPGFAVTTTFQYLPDAAIS